MRPLLLVVAVAENGVIGRGNALPWRLRTDLARFKALTMGKPMIMGRRSWDSIGRPLPGRDSVVLTRDPDFRAEGARVVHAWADALALADDLAAERAARAIAVIGGAEVFRLALPAASRLALTRVHAHPDGDVVFPDHDPTDFAEVSRELHEAGPGDEHPFTFIDLVRRPDRKP